MWTGLLGLHGARRAALELLWRLAAALLLHLLHRRLLGRRPLRPAQRRPLRLLAGLPGHPALSLRELCARLLPSLGRLGSLWLLAPLTLLWRHRRLPALRRLPASRAARRLLR